MAELIDTVRAAASPTSPRLNAQNQRIYEQGTDLIQLYCPRWF